MLERLLGKAFREGGELGRGGARGEGTVPAGLACRDGGVRSGSRRIPCAPEVNGVRACIAG